MANSAGLVAWLLESLAPLGGVSARRMFSGHGLFRQGLMFLLVARDTAFLKVDEQTRPAFEAAGSEAFTYDRGGKPAALGYWRVPDAVLDDPEELCRWAGQAMAVAARAAVKKPPRR